MELQFSNASGLYGMLRPQRPPWWSESFPGSNTKYKLSHFKSNQLWNL